MPAASAATCFGAGTLILTESGYLPIESLDVGDLVQSITGELKPVKWIGRRRVNFTRLSCAEADINRPVRISASSLGASVPFCDLTLSRCHVVAYGERANLAGNLVNNVTIVFLENVEEITYYHIEFDVKEIIFANGLMAESYVDCGNRAKFDNYSGRAQCRVAYGPTGEQIIEAVKSGNHVKSDRAQSTINRIFQDRGMRSNLM